MSALNAAARLLGYNHYQAFDWVLTYRDAALVRAGLNSLAPGWAKVIWSALRQTSTIARSLRLIDADTATDILDIPPPRGSAGHSGRTPSDDEVGLMLDVAACDQTIRGRRDAAVLAVLAGGGLRRAEAAALTVGDWDARTRRLTVRHAKNRVQRVVPLPMWAADLIDVWMISVPASGPLLVEVDRWRKIGGHLSGHALNSIICRLAETARIDPVTCHGLRRYALSSLLRVSDVGMVQRMAGHSDVSTTIRCYDARSLDELDDAVTKRTSPGTITQRLRAV